MLDHTHVQRLRPLAIRSQFRRRIRGKRVTARFCGGPLDQIRTTAAAEAAEGLYLRFCLVTERGRSRPCTPAMTLATGDSRSDPASGLAEYRGRACCRFT